MLHLRLRPILTTITRLGAARSSSTSTAPLRFTGPNGYTGDYLADRRGAEKFVNDAGWDMESLVEIPIEWGQHDGFGHVNNVHAFSFFEHGRMAFMRSLFSEMDDPDGAEQSLMLGKPGNVGMILATTSARYRRPVTFPDTLLVAHRPLPLVKPDRWSLETLCYSFRQQEVVTLGECELVAYDYGNLQKMNIPQDLRRALEKRMKK